jgi:Galactose oxidase, central domain
MIEVPTGNSNHGRSAFAVSMGRIVLLATFAGFAIAHVASAADVVGTARLIRERRGHTATALGNGKILVAGGQNLSGALSDVAIFDSATGTFTATVRLLTPRAEHTATRLGDGRIFLIGGRGTEPLTSTEFYDGGSIVIHK